MSSRRDFLKQTGTLVTTAWLAGTEFGKQLVEGEEKSLLLDDTQGVPEELYDRFSPYDEFSEMLTEGMFTYLKKKNFPFRRVEEVSFIDDAGNVKKVRSRKLRTGMEHEGHNPANFRVPPGGLEYLYQDLLLVLEQHNARKLYIYSFVQTPLFYDPQNFVPRTGVLVRYAY